MQAKELNKLSLNINRQKTLLNFFSVQNDKDQEKCSCGVSYPVSKISWHRDFECESAKRSLKSSDSSTYKKSNKRMKSKRKSNKPVCKSEEEPTNSDDDVIILDDLDEESFESLSGPEGMRCGSPNLFDMDSRDEENCELEEKNSLLDELKLDWDSPNNSPVKPPVANVVLPINIKKEKSKVVKCEKNSPSKYKDFSLLSSTESENEFEKDIVYSPAHRQTSKKKSKYSVGENLSNIKKCNSDADKTNITIKSELNPMLMVETTFSETSNLSSEDILKYPTLVSPERTPSPSPEKSAKKKSQTVEISSQILSSPHRFSLKKKLANLQNGEIEVNIICSDTQASNSGIKRTPRHIVNSVKKSLLKNGYFQNNSSPVRRNLFTDNDNTTKSPTKIKSLNSPNKYRNYNGMYLDNFLHIIDVVTSQPQDLALFSDNDLKYIKNFHQLSLQAQKLYVRLFQRKMKWNKVSKIEYKEICDKEDTSLYINELVYAEFLLAECHLSNLEVLLTLLDVNGVRKVCKDMKLQTSGTKENLIARLIRSEKQQMSISSFCKSKSSESQVFKMAKELVGKCFILQKDGWNVFTRTLHLYSPMHFDEDEENGQQAQLTALLMMSIGKMKFPEYKVIREHSIYRSRDDLIRFQTFMQMEFEIQECIKNQNWDEAVIIFQQVEEIFSEIENDQEMINHDATLPPYLRRFTTISLICHIRTLAVEVYQRQKHYLKAVKQLEQLLGQKTHRQDCRGRWYDRLALNLHQHLKRPAKALDVLKEALADPLVRVGHRLSLSQRAERLLNSKATQKQAAKYENELALMEYQEAPKICIQGKCLPADIPGYKRIFISSEEGNEKNDVMCSVEELALNYYKREGYPKGLHSEGRIIAALFGFFFWDILYLPIPDVFRTRHQAAPLDLDSSEFYQQRKKAIEKRLKNMRSWTLEEANGVVKKVWSDNEDSICLIDWKLFSSLDFLQGLIAGLGLKVISAICERLAKEHRFTRSGFPDLIVWNHIEKTSRIVEVKGPNDKLSTKQILWLDFLIKNGAVAEVCHVEAVGQKRIGKLKTKKISPRKRGKEKDSNLDIPEKSSLENTENSSPQKRTKGVKRKRKN